jgi:hypothetical protein
MNAETIKTCREALVQLRKFYRQEIYALDLNNELAKQELVDKFRAIDAAMADLDATPAAPAPPIPPEVAATIQEALIDHRQNAGRFELVNSWRNDQKEWVPDIKANAAIDAALFWLDALRQEAGNE